MSTGTAPAWSRESLQARIDNAPFNAWLGLALVDWDVDGITLGLRLRRELCGHATLNALHGGILASLVDTGCSMAVVARTGESVLHGRHEGRLSATRDRDGYTVRAKIVRLGADRSQPPMHMSSPRTESSSQAGARCSSTSRRCSLGAVRLRPEISL